MARTNASEPIGARPAGRTGSQSKIADVVAQRVIAEIVDGDLRPGAMLPAEKDMIEQYGVGRGTLREALRHLELQGVLSIRPGPGGGPQVAMPGTENLASSMTLLLSVSRTPFSEVVEVAAALAPVVAQLAASHADNGDIVALRECLGRLEEYLRTKDRPAYMREAPRFQELLATASGNGLLRLLFGALENIINGGHTGVVYSLAQMKLTLGIYSGVVDAVAAGDGPRARALMRDHTEAWRQMLARQHADALERPVRWTDS